MSARVVAASVAVLSFFASGCRPSTADGNGADVKTDLIDNEAVARATADYKENVAHCTYVAGRKRAIVTGFGLFGAPFNISGIVAMSMAKATFFPDKIRLDGSSEPLRADAVWKHAEALTKNGGEAHQRTLEIDGETYEVCFLLLDVKWDQAAAIVLEESQAFRPRLIVLSGMNGNDATNVLFESGAVNNASRTVGYDRGGDRAAVNVRVDGDPRILPDLELDARVELTWDAAALASGNAALLGAIPGVERPYTASVGAARDGNNYICNNISLVVARDLAGKSVHLAGGKVEIPGQTFGTKAGFLHYPSLSSTLGHADDGRQIFAWTKVLANTLKISLANVAPD